MTGSGKTEVYLRVAQEKLAAGKSVMMVVPEIALTPRLHEYVLSALDTHVVMLHSRLTPAQRRNAHFDLLNGRSRVLVGARSALFAPMPDLGLIVVDEEHDHSLKQDQTPRYHGRDVAIWRAHNEKATIVLGSATPSLESILNVKKGKLTKLCLKKRIGGKGKLPSIEIVDLRKDSEHPAIKKGDKPNSPGQSLVILSGKLRAALSQVLTNNEQAILFLNRRGYASFGLCKSCGEILQCKCCSISLTYHKSANLLKCHQCDYFEPLPKSCSKCNEKTITYFGLGTERLEKEVKLMFPNASVARLDKESSKTLSNLQKIISQMQEGKIDILIGTQMVAKGHDFPNVSLVGVVLADTGLSMPDFRASEKTFQLLTQVAGRAGRGDSTGKVIIQTFNPTHPSITLAKNHDTRGFANLEIQIRAQTSYPPFTRAVLLRLEAKDPSGASQAADTIKRFIIRHLAHENLKTQVILIGPAPAPIDKLRGKTRYQLFIKSKTNAARKKCIENLVENKEVAKKIKKLGAKLIIDVDPFNML